MAKLVLEATGVLLLLGWWVAMVPRWRLALELFVLFIPFAGVIELLLYPAPWAVLIKDFLFAIPAYIGFAMSGELGPALARIPKSAALLILLFISLVLVQSLNPSGPNLLSTLIGLKVWLFYVPMLLLGRAYVRDEASLLRLSRLMSGLVWLPCSVGIMLWLLSLASGYQYTMSLFYGAAARAATQNFSRFENGVMRIPSTFAFPAQYLNYIVCMFVPVLGCLKLESSRRLKTLQAFAFGLLCIAGFMTGERAAFVMVPLLVGIFYVLYRGALGLAWAGVVLALFLTFTLSISAIDPPGLLQMETELTRSYATGQAQEIASATQQTWIGRGVGYNTGAARVAAEDPKEFVRVEGYYAKAIVEFGFFGLMTVAAIQLALLLFALRARARCRKSAVEPYCEAIAALILVYIVYNYKGATTQLDPGNMLYWLFAGVLFSLPGLAYSVRIREAWASVRCDVHEHEADDSRVAL